MRERMMPSIEEPLIARHKLPADFYFFNAQWDKAFEYLTLTGRDNKHDKRSRNLSFTIHRDEIPTLEREWEDSTGKCARCSGDGKRATSWSRETGTTYQPCGDCAGTGSAHNA